MESARISPNPSERLLLILQNGGCTEDYCGESVPKLCSTLRDLRDLLVRHHYSIDSSPYMEQLQHYQLSAPLNNL